MDKASLAFFSDTESPLTLLMKQNIEQADTMQTHLESRAPDHSLWFMGSRPGWCGPQDMLSILRIKEKVKGLTVEVVAPQLVD